ncbi:MAG TPA: FkbM family methyltransferase [Isosphaeraceae bacterium]|jgi:FkbM family methyltransferase|nr:FkbM family methyltransferase [Isosphaeraceae bacterium]
MTMISYAQNGEDVLLRRVFGDTQAGFYIDVGACHPTLHSVTKHFYDRGWSGINIEPVSTVFEVLRAERPRDVNLNVGLSDRPGTLDFFEAPSSLGRSTFSTGFRDGWNAHDGCEFVRRSVEVLTLALVCERHADRPIDFLKIDVEGHERAVLAGADFARWRPRVVLIEGRPGYIEDWEGLILGADYLFATFDGINCYYVRAEDRQFMPTLAVPINVQDDYTPHSHYSAIQRYAFEFDEACGRLNAATERMATLDAELQAMRGRLAGLDDLGPTALAVARRAKHAARRHPLLASLVRKIARAV